MTTGKVHDVIPLKDLNKISECQERAADLEYRARLLEQEAQDLRVRADDIVTEYRLKVEREGWETCRQEAKHQDMISWRFDPLPGAVR